MTITITLTEDQISTISEALRYMASDMDTVGSRHRQKEINGLRWLAAHLDQQATSLI